MIKKEVNFLNESVAVDISGMVALNYFSEFGKDINSVFTKFTKLSKYGNDSVKLVENLDPALLNECANIAFIMVRNANGDKFKKIEDFYGSFPCGDLSMACIQLVMELFNTQRTTVKEKVNFKKKVSRGK